MEVFVTEASGAMIECTTFQEALTDYLEGTVCPEVRSACAAHRLSCRECRRLCEQVKESLRLLRLVGDEPPSPRLELANLANRIVLATTPGEMLGCEAFDHLIGQYFDGVIMAPDYQEFQYHFEACARCRRLLATIEETAPMLGWGRWTIARNGQTLRLDVENSPFAKGYGASPKPVCHAVVGMLEAVSAIVLGAPVIARETTCAATGAARCEFEARTGKV